VGKETEMSKRGEEALARIEREETAKDPQFMDKVEYHTHLWNKYVNEQDCSNQFAYRGSANCPTLPEICSHIKEVDNRMLARYPDMKEEE
jgi:hypothetical protein